MDRAERTARRARDVLKAAQRSVGGVLGWSALGEKLQWGLICAEIVAVCTAQDPSIPAERRADLVVELEEAVRVLFHERGQIPA